MIFLYFIPKKKYIRIGKFGQRKERERINENKLINPNYDWAPTSLIFFLNG